MDQPLIYLASPYTRHDLTGPKKLEAEALRFRMVAKAAAFFMDQGHLIFCPITHTHPLVPYGLQHKTGDWWLRQDFAILKNCQQLWVYMLSGWNNSYGIKKEIEFCERNDIPIMYIEPLEKEYKYESEPLSNTWHLVRI